MIQLTDEDVLFFKENGYLIKRNVLDSDLMARARERMWDGAPPGVEQDNPVTWIGPLQATSQERDNAYGGYSWKYRELGSEDWMLRLLPKNPSVWHMAEQLLGKGTLAEPQRVRGIYCIMPEGEIPDRTYGCHVDGHPFHLGVVGYIDDVPPNGGGFTVWPKSHRTFYYDFFSQYKHEPKPEHAEHLKSIKQQPYVDCYGNAGDIVFWHHRIGHSAGHNRSCQIRKAVLYDFRRIDLEQTMEEPPCEDMWRDWDGIH